MWSNALPVVGSIWYEEFKKSTSNRGYRSSKTVPRMPRYFFFLFFSRSHQTHNSYLLLYCVIWISLLNPLERLKLFCFNCARQFFVSDNNMACSRPHRVGRQRTAIDWIESVGRLVTPTSSFTNLFPLTDRTWATDWFAWHFIWHDYMWFQPPAENGFDRISNIIRWECWLNRKCIWTQSKKYAIMEW